MNILFGPFLTNLVSEQPAPQFLRDSGFCLEFSSSEAVVQLQIFHYLKPIHPNPEDCGIDTLYLSVDSFLSTPLNSYEFKCRDGDVLSIAESEFLSLGKFLPQLYEFCRPPTSLLSLIDSMLLELDLPAVAVDQEYNKSGFFSKDMSDSGVRISRITSCGQSLLVDLAYVASNDRDLNASRRQLRVGSMNFRPSGNNCLGLGSWQKLEEGYIYHSVDHELRKDFRKKPSHYLTEEGKRLLVSKFEWTTLTRKCFAEQRSARRNFVNAHPEMHDDLTVLVKSMKNAGLYSQWSSEASLKPGLKKMIFDSP